MVIFQLCHQGNLHFALFALRKLKWFDSGDCLYRYLVTMDEGQGTCMRYNLNYMESSLYTASCRSSLSHSEKKTVILYSRCRTMLQESPIHQIIPDIRIIDNFAGALPILKERLRDFPLPISPQLWVKPKISSYVFQILQK